MQSVCWGPLSKMEKGDFPLHFYDPESWDVLPPKWRTINTKREFLEYILPHLLECVRRFEELGGGLFDVVSQVSDGKLPGN